MIRDRNRLFGFAVVALGLLAAGPARAAWQNNLSYGGSGNPTMDLYSPTTPKASAGIIVALHYCTGNAGATHSWFESLANQHGFYIISPNSGVMCWDARVGRDGPKAAIVKMIDYVVTQKGADRTRVFAAGASAGACMTNTLLASYPEIFAGGSVLAGVPAGEWTTDGSSCGGCNKMATMSAMAYGNIVRNANPGYTGPRPRVQLWHGTSDGTLLYPSQLNAEVAQWSNVFGVSMSNATMQANTPKSPWTRTSYKDSTDTVVLEVNIGQGVGHDLTGAGLFADVVRFFGLDRDATGGPDGGAGGSTGTGGTTGRGGSSGTGTGGGTGGSGTGVAGTSGTGGTGTGSGGSVGTGGSGPTTGIAGTAGSTTGRGGTTGTGTGSAGTGGPAGTTGATGAAGSGSGTTGATGTSGGAGGRQDDGGWCAVGSRTGHPGASAIALLLAALGLTLRPRKRRR